MNALIKRIKEEPVMVMAIIEAAIAVVVVFGIAVTAAQAAAILALVGAILTFIARKQVTPNVKIPTPQPPTQPKRKEAVMGFRNE